MLLVAAVVLTIPPGLDLYMPVPEDNPVTEEKIALGRRLFFDRRLSRDNTLSCVSCHDPKQAFSDGRPLAIGVKGRKGNRNSPALINRGYGRAFFWDGRVKSLEEQVLQPITNPRELDLTLPELEARLQLTSREISQALATYVRTILSGDSPYDRFINGQRDALSPQAQRGLQLFRGKANCIACHVTPNFTDEKLHNTGVERAGSGSFKTPTLREVARTAPYMHDGSIKTLAEVIDFYDRGGRPNPNLDPELRPLGLARQEQQDLIAFLLSLSGPISW